MPSGKNAWLTFLTFDLLIKIVILHALLAVSMTNILLVIFAFFSTLVYNPFQLTWNISANEETDK